MAFVAIVLGFPGTIPPRFFKLRLIPFVHERLSPELESGPIASYLIFFIFFRPLFSQRNRKLGNLCAQPDSLMNVVYLIPR